VQIINSGPWTLRFYTFRFFFSNFRTLIGIVPLPAGQQAADSVTVMPD
jgi:hypothetical protein